MVPDGRERLLRDTVLGTDLDLEKFVEVIVLTSGDGVREPESVTVIDCDSDRGGDALPDADSVPDFCMGEGDTLLLLVTERVLVPVSVPADFEVEFDFVAVTSKELEVLNVIVSDSVNVGVGVAVPNVRENVLDTVSVKVSVYATVGVIDAVAVALVTVTSCEGVNVADTVALTVREEVRETEPLSDGLSESVLLRCGDGERDWVGESVAVKVIEPERIWLKVMLSVTDRGCCVSDSLPVALALPERDWERGAVTVSENVVVKVSVDDVECVRVGLSRVTVMDRNCVRDDDTDDVGSWVIVGDSDTVAEFDRVLSSVAEKVSERDSVAVCEALLVRDADGSEDAEKVSVSENDSVHEKVKDLVGVASGVIDLGSVPVPEYDVVSLVDGVSE